MVDPVYALTWPRPFFQWEAQRILRTFGSTNWLAKVKHLLYEAYHDEAVADSFDSQFSPSARAWANAVNTIEDDARKWLHTLLADESRLQAYRPPVYWAERNSDAGTAPSAPALSLRLEFFELIDTLSYTGYFPKVLPKPCEDDYSELPDVGLAIRRATKLDLPWPLETTVDKEFLPDAALYSLIEYFHDQAQRPQWSWEHNWNNCGLHYEDFTGPSGQAIYRWRVNTLLEAHDVPLRLGSTGEEQGRLIRHFRSPLDELAAEQVALRVDNPGDEVAHAVRMYRMRDATLPNKRAAINLLAREMEPKRRTIERKISSSDASDLFQIANKFNIRHRDKAQKSDYGEEFLDWIFWTYLATVRLLDELEAKTSQDARDDADTA